MSPASAVESQRRWFHLTRRDRLDSIMRHGLRGDSPRLLSGEHTPGWIEHIYGARPVFVSRTPWMEREHWDLLADYGRPADFALLRVDVAGLRLLPDVMTLGDKGAYLEDSDLWFEDDDHPLKAWLKAGAISYRDLFSNVELARATIDWTGTAAILEPVAPARIRLA